MNEKSIRNQIRQFSSFGRLQRKRAFCFLCRSGQRKCPHGMSACQGVRTYGIGSRNAPQVYFMAIKWKSHPFTELSIFFTSQPFHITHPRSARAAVAHPLAQTGTKGCKVPFWRREASSVAGRWHNAVVFYPSTALAHRCRFVGFLQ